MNFALILLTILGVLFFISAIYALWWAAKTGQFHKMEQGAKTIFTPEEPEGTQTDFFPQAKKKTPTPTPPSGRGEDKSGLRPNAP